MAGAEPGYLLGTDSLGRDVLSRIIFGARVALVVALVAGTATCLVGSALGLAAGFYRGWTERIVGRLVDIWMAFPPVLFAILLIAVLGTGLTSVVLAIIVIDWTRFCRVVRAETLNQAQMDYVQSARVAGFPRARTLLAEILPNVRGPIVVDACLRLGYTTVAITTLTFLGLGLQPPDPDWGLMIKEAASAALVWRFAYMMIVPAIAVSSLILGFNLMADGLREMSLKD